MDLPGYVCVPIDTNLYNELVLRVGDPERDVGAIIDEVLLQFLERTADDGDWSDAYYAWRDRQRPAKESLEQYGDPDKGYFWTPVFLPNGTKFFMPYGGQNYFAEIRHEKIFYDGREMPSPSVLASTIARGTSRNAWVSLQIKRPKDTAFRPADVLRREGARK